jgi:hypothetical protein
LTDVFQNEDKEVRGAGAMGKLRRRFGFERLESRYLMAAGLTPEVALSETPISSLSTPPPFAASIDIDAVQGLRAAAVEIRFDQDKFKADQTSVRAGSAWGGKGMAIANVNNDEGTINIFLFAANETDGVSGSLIEIDFEHHESTGNDQPPKIDVESVRINDGDPTMVSAVRDSQLKIVPLSSGSPSPDDAPQTDPSPSEMVDTTGEMTEQNVENSENRDIVAVLVIKPIVDTPTADPASPLIQTEELVAIDEASPIDEAPPVDETAIALPSLGSPLADRTESTDAIGDTHELQFFEPPAEHPAEVCIPVRVLPIVYGPERPSDHHLDDEHSYGDFGVADPAQEPSPMPPQTPDDEVTLAAPPEFVSAMLSPAPDAKPDAQTFSPLDAGVSITSPSKPGPLAFVGGSKSAKRIAAMGMESARPSRPAPAFLSLPIQWRTVNRDTTAVDEESTEDTTV